MIPRLNISFSFQRQWHYWFGTQYEPSDGEYLLNHARAGIVLALRASLPHGGRVGVVAYNCHTVANAVVNAGCTPVFVDVCPDLRIDMKSVPADLDAIVVTNLFGIRNDIAAIRKRCPKAVIIVDNAHGYGLPVEGDFTIYSINQGKFPALGEGGILRVNELKNERVKVIDEMYASLQKYGIIAQMKLFCLMLIKAIAYSCCIYWLTMKMKAERMKELTSERIKEKVVMRQMAPGIRRLYQAWLPNAEKEIAEQCKNAMVMSERMKVLGNECIVGENAFMLIVKTQDPAALQAWFAERGVETATHFSRAIDWAKEFGYVAGTCPQAEKLTKQLLMVPTYCEVKSERLKE